MKQYLGVKLVTAEPEVSMIDGRNEQREGYKVGYEDGYVSWSPKVVFEKAYRIIDGLTFGLAIEAMRMGKKVCRAGWNGKGMFIYIQESSIVPVVCMNPNVTKHMFGESLLECDASVKIQAHIDMKAADGTLTIGWNPSQIDMLSEDWMVVD